MKLNISYRLFSIISVLIILGCNQRKGVKSDTTKEISNHNTITTFNFDNKQDLSEYNKLNLDETHPNLLNPQISKSDYNSVMKSWTNLHERIGEYLSKNKFSWEIEDQKITIVHKFYFDSKGDIKSYFFNILNKGITDKKKKQYADLISKFAKENRIKYEKKQPFAQCGKTEYLNN